MKIAVPLTIYCCVALSTAVSAQTKLPHGITIAASPHPHVTITPLPTSSSQATPALFNGALAPLKPASFFLSNETDQPIIGLVVTWSITDQNGKQHTQRFSSDSFLDINQRHVLEAHSQLLVAPRLFMRSENVARFADNPFFQMQKEGLQRTAAAISTASAIKVNVDSIIFANGDLYGADTQQFARDLAARKAAAQSIVQAVNGATANGGSAIGLISQIAQTPVLRADPLAMWKRRFAQQLIKSSNFQRTLTFLEHLPSVPAITRKDS